jgi:hypothetical protein
MGSSRGILRALGVLASSCILLGRRLRNPRPRLLDRFTVDSGSGVVGAGTVAETRVSGREPQGSAGRDKSLLTSNFWEAVELAGDEGASVIANGRRGDVVNEEDDQLGADSSN